MSQVRRGKGWFKVKGKFKMVMRPTESMTASSGLAVGAQARWTMGPPENELPNLVYGVGSLRPQEPSLG